MPEAETYRQFFLSGIEKIGISEKEVFSSLFDYQIKDIEKDEVLIRWCLSSFSTVICTENVNSLMDLIQSRAPKAKYCATQYDIEQNIGQFQIFVKDSDFFGQPKVSLIRSLQMYSGS